MLCSLTNIILPAKKNRHVTARLLAQDPLSFKSIRICVICGSDNHDGNLSVKLTVPQSSVISASYVG